MLNLIALAAWVSAHRSYHLLMRRKTELRSAQAFLALMAGLWLLCPGSAGAVTGFVPATDLDAVSTGTMNDSAVASAPDGTAFVAWTKPGTPARAKVAVRRPGGNWNTQDLGPATATTGGTG